MATAEFREFYLRAAMVNSGTKPDKEVGFAVQYQSVDCDGNAVTVFNRFLKNHVPSEAVYKKLLESITFKLNPEDTASALDTGQGLVRIAIGSQIVNRSDVEGGITTVVVPSELPKVSAVSGCTVTPVIRRVSDNVIVGSITPGDRGLYYIDYQITVPAPPTVIDNVKNTDSFNVDTTLAMPGDFVVNGAGCNLNTVVLAANTLVTDGDHVEIELTVDKSVAGVGTSTESLELQIGGSALAGVLDGVGWDPNISELALHVHVKCKLYRVSATELRFISTRKIYSRPNANGGYSLFDAVAGAGVSETADVYQTGTVTVNFAAPISIDTYFNLLEADVNTHTPLVIYQFTKAIVD